MENPIWNLSAKGASAIAVLVLSAGILLIAASYLGLTEGPTAGFAVLSLGSVIALFAIAATNFENLTLERQHGKAVEAAELLSQGQLLDRTGEGHLIDAVCRVSDYLKEKAAIAERIAAGSMSEQFSPASDSDALGRSLQKLNSVIREAHGSVNSRDRLHDAVIKLLDEVSGASAGDLTIHADVDQEITGPIADAFNSMTENLRLLIGQVKDITNQVGASAGSISETTEQLARGSVVQAAQVTRTTAAIGKMAKQIQEVSQNAEISSNVASDSLQKARSGTAAAADNINAMRCVRKQVQETAKRVKRLGERSQEIGQMVALIEDLSDRTSLLALNASLKASAAGQAGAAFVPVAEEVEKLAERSNRLTRQISALTQTINTETKEVVASMEDTIHEVVVGSTLADKAGKALYSLESTSMKLAELLRSISESAKYQARSSEDISNAMASISEVTEIVESGSQRAAESVRSLVRLSDTLQSSVSPFKLPPSPAHSPSDAVEQFVN